MPSISVPSKPTYKILSFNAGYYLGYTGTLYDYVRHPIRSVIGASTEEDAIAEFADIIDSVAPDAVLLQEIDRGSIRTNTAGQMQHITNHCSAFKSHTAVKYQGHIVPRIPVFRHMANGLLYKQGTVTDHYLGRGVKSLVQELRIDGLSIFSVHLARFGKRTRRRQLEEIADIVGEHENALIVGDFNAMNGAEEANILRDRLDFTIASPGNTYPASNPQHPLDLAAYSPGLSVRCRTLDSTISDHVPLLVTIED